MKQARYEQRGPVPQDVIAAVESATPAPAPGQVLVEVLAAPINPSDLLTLTGEYGLLPPLPAVGGNEGVGRVAALGEGVSAPAIGTVVLLPPSGGSWSTHLLADPRALLPLPEADPVQLSMITVNPPTARLLLTEFVDLQPGDWVIQNAANSAVGGYLVQLAALRGLRTLNVVRRESAVAGVRELGGDVVLVDGDDLSRRVREATDGAPVRLGIDAVGGGATERLAQSLSEGGVLVNYGAMSGEACALSPAQLVFRDIALRGFWLARWYRLAPMAQRVGLLQELAGLITQGALRTRVQAVYGIDRIKDAVAAAAAGEREGKIVLVPNQT
ncbi:zinc-dependent alcohol dehydrogenase family protein [Lysobacter silvisoli]|uniref:enoyl-[acyl-carrier-protein] reductase n=1 Tax=Lysobacter silvisoli TaxID=2293254 RepID=A0A371K1M4_9GAMM|nr:zinc-dependent alcohol dehydrogenase family protein [Lysobacter silvisoli]RDZ27747.1 alcohol dehydrogenase [Lysobacter silvisoli]